MKKVAIVIDEMSIGGIPKACVDFANQLNEICDVVLLMKRDDGPMMNGLSKNISVKLIQSPDFKSTIRRLKEKHKYFKLLEYALGYFLLTRLSNRWVKANELTAKMYGIYEDDNYDCVITYHGMSISQLLISLYGVKAAKKIAWIHGDHPFEGVHKRDINSVYRQFDKIFCVSPSVCIRFLKDFPDLKNIVESYKNLLLPRRIQKLSEEIIPEKVDSDGVNNIVTVGRVSKEKGQEMIPSIVRKLKCKGIKVHWYIVGDGDDTERIRKISSECGVEDSIYFLGSKSNPYPYMKMCDIYVQPSYTEGYCLTVCEAAILKKPIVLTEIAAAEILENEQTAMVVNANVDSIVDGIEKLILHPELGNKFRKNLSDIDLSNSHEIDKLIRII